MEDEGFDDDSEGEAATFNSNDIKIRNPYEVRELYKGALGKNLASGGVVTSMSEWVNDKIKDGNPHYDHVHTSLTQPEWDETYYRTSQESTETWFELAQIRINKFKVNEGINIFDVDFELTPKELRLRTKR